MGFFSNVMNEFGTKTGKALGNKLYGKHADDFRIGYSETESGSKQSNFDVDDYIEAKLMVERMDREDERNDELLNELLTVEYDHNDKDSIVRHTAKFASLVDFWLMNGKEDQKLSAAKSKFDIGLALLTAVEPTNPMIPYFNSKKVEWASKEKEAVCEKEKKKRKSNITLIILILVCLLPTIIIFASVL